MKISQFHFSKIPPKYRQYLVIAIGCTALLLVLMVFSQEDNKVVRVAPKTDRSVNVLTDQKHRNLGMDAIASRVNSLAKENQRLRAEVDRLSKDISDTRSNDALERQMRDRYEKLHNEITRLRELQTQSSAFTQGMVNTESSQDESEIGNPFQPESNSPSGIEVGNAASKSSGSSNSSAGAKSKSISKITSTNNRSYPRSITIVSEDDDVPIASTRNRKGKKSEGSVNYIPAGSIMTGTLITGGDFPTGSGGKENPMPVLVRLTKTAILPNRFQSDVRECFMLMSGHGDLSSERAKFRGETLSCVRHDGGVIQTKLSSYVAGEDGKEGIKGRLVSKQGQMIARTLFAGFLSGISKAFDYSPVEVLSTSSTGTVQYQSHFSLEAAKSGFAKGMSTAAEKVADFYAKLADAMVPVVEITPGRQVDIVVVSGARIDPKVVAKLSTEGSGSINN